MHQLGTIEREPGGVNLAGKVKNLFLVTLLLYTG